MSEEKVDELMTAMRRSYVKATPSKHSLHSSVSRARVSRTTSVLDSSSEQSGAHARPTPGSRGATQIAVRISSAGNIFPSNGNRQSSSQA